MQEEVNQHCSLNTQIKAHILPKLKSKNESLSLLAKALGKHGLN
jgi:hypothetical protein